ncbi:polyadenylate-binding protein-interacting protein 3-like isoform X2 [Rutidosis leptorrhynchoides]|uniref:polyadenylate-binding protein-interacting protein 3-like isoform X2 n=1 Tax=Rutidosis leptorrhynchoides TaxID=125765 RepID=UPI003A98DD0C
MNPHQVAQPRSSSNGFNRGRGEKETGTRLGSKSQPGKVNYNKSSTSGVQAGNKGGVESPSRERLVYVTTCLIGHQVEVQVIDGSVYSGIFHATDVRKDFGIILKMARVTKAGSSRGQKNISDSVQKPPSKILIIPAKDLVQIVAKSVSITRDGLVNELQHDQLHDIMIDSSISQSRHVDLERELEPWVPDDDNPVCPELDNTFDRHWNRGWNQFEANAALFGVTSTFDEELYTTKLVRGPQMIEREREALRIAREIEGEDTQDLHLAEERGIHFHEKFDLDEETKYSSVFRGVDDSGYDEDEDVLDSQNNETFGDVSDSIMNKSFSEALQVEAQRSLLSTSSDIHPSGSMDGQSRIQDYQTNQHAGSNYSKEDKENKTVCDQSQASKLKELPNNVSGNNEPPASATAKAQEKTSSSDKAEVASATFKIHAPTVSRAHPATLASPSSEPGNVAPTASVATASAPGLSRSSSISSFTSEKSTLNPHAKEFRLNPNAKSFVPSPTQLKAASPVSDGSFYYPANVAPVQHMQGMPVGVGMGPSYPPHQPVIFGPQGTPLQTPQTYFHPNGPQYGQQMLLGQPRQVYYMPNFPPEMPYKGREY